jgi:two-component system, OmpR family, phosphate regulon sensor histidine kinase PhoR
MYAESWWVLLAKLLVTVGAGLVIGLIVHQPWPAVAAVLAVLLLFQLSNLARLARWLRDGTAEAPPELGGLWGGAVARILRLFRRKQYHKQRLLRLLRELRQSTAAMPDGVVVLNPQSEILWFNRTAGLLLQFRGRGDVGLRIENLVRQPEFVRYLRSGSYASPVIVRAAAGIEQYLSIQIVPYGAGQLLVLVRDVTREALLEAMRKDFVANASHELRSPLTVISGYLETLAQDAQLDPLISDPIQEMRRQALRMNAIVKDLLELSRLEASDRPVVGIPIDVASLLAQLKQDVLARPTHPAQVSVAVDSPVGLLGEEEQIHSAFANLVDNAAKYTPAGGSIGIRWWRDAAGGHFAVTDTGIGIAPEHLPRLTERFYRADPGRSRATGGSGLGLAIVKHVLQRHGASLQIESVEGRGSTFTCHFPPERVQQSG